MTQLRTAWLRGMPEDNCMLKPKGTSIYDPTGVIYWGNDSVCLWGGGLPFKALKPFMEKSQEVALNSEFGYTLQKQTQEMAVCDLSVLEGDTVDAQFDFLARRQIKSRLTSHLFGAKSREIRVTDVKFKDREDAFSRLSIINKEFMKIWDLTLKTTAKFSTDIYLDNSSVTESGTISCHHIESGDFLGEIVYFAIGDTYVVDPIIIPHKTRSLHGKYSVYAILHLYCIKSALHAGKRFVDFFEVLRPKRFLNFKWPTVSNVGLIPKYVKEGDNPQYSLFPLFIPTGSIKKLLLKMGGYCEFPLHTDNSIFFKDYNVSRPKIPLPIPYALTDKQVQEACVKEGAPLLPLDTTYNGKRCDFDRNAEYYCFNNGVFLFSWKKVGKDKFLTSYINKEISPSQSEGFWTCEVKDKGIEEYNYIYSGLILGNDPFSYLNSLQLGGSKYAGSVSYVKFDSAPSWRKKADTVGNIYNQPFCSDGKCWDSGGMYQIKTKPLSYINYIYGY